MLAIAWAVQRRRPGAYVKGHNPLSRWMRGGFLLLSAFALLSGLSLFLVPEVMTAVWPSAVTPLANSSWLSAFGVTCAVLAMENDIKNGAGTSSSLFAFCVLELIVVARYASLMDWGKPLAIGYNLFLWLGVVVSGANLLANRRLAN